MGNAFFDKFSLLHFAWGVSAYYWDLPLLWWVLLHAVFELFENSAQGMALINRFPFWPGGKTRADGWVNMVGDTVFAALGHMFASWFADQF